MLREEVYKALQVLKAGGIILYPTDTIWGIGCDATNEAAVEKIYALKKRPSEKSMIVLLDTANKLESYVKEVPAVAFDLIDYAEKPLTIIFSDAKNLAKNLINTDGSIGIRIAKNAFCQSLIQQHKKPIVSTSANISGAPSPSIFSEIDDEIIKGVDYVVNLDQQNTSPGTPSTIMKIDAKGVFSFIRK